VEGIEKMDISIIVAIIVGIVNFIALLIVAWQTYLTRQSVNVSDRNLFESQKAREFSNLPKAYPIISVQNHLRNWKQDLQLLIDGKKQIKKYIDKSGADIKLNTQYYSGDTKFISKGEYNTLPDWLKMILIAGAQYYYEGMCLTGVVCSTQREKQFRLSLLKDMIERAQIGLKAITEMQKYIDNLVPAWYLESPASLNDSDFLY